MTGGWYTSGSAREGAVKKLVERVYLRLSSRAPAERTTQVQVKAPGPRVAQRETPGPRAARPEVRGPRVARPRAPGPRSAQQGSPETVPAFRENLQEKDRQVTVSEPPGQSETETPARDQKVWRR